MLNDDFDIVVIGGGAAGLFAVSVANSLGAKACLVEKNKLGGDCTWYGCVPSKAILKAAEVAQLSRSFQTYGLKAHPTFKLDCEGVFKHVRSIVQGVYDGHGPEVFEKRGIKVVFGTPHFDDPYTLVVGQDKIRAKKFILCMGSHAKKPDINGINSIDFLTNESLFQLETLPKSMLVLGGGPIGCEMAQAFQRLGVQVTLVQHQRILPHDEPELTKIVENQLRNDGVTVVYEKNVVSFENHEKFIRCVLSSENEAQETVDVEKVLVSVGRAPNLEGLSLNKAKVKYNEKGVKVNEYLQTTSDHIFACGDIVAPYQFSHVAAYEAAVAVRNALFKKLPFVWQKVDYSNIVWATFTDPELARVGMNEKEARNNYKDVSVYVTDYGNVDRAKTDRCLNGKVKVITDRKGYILGAHVVGSQAGEIIQGFLIAKSQGIKLSKLANSMFIYPTLSELVKKTAAKPLIETGDKPLIKGLIRLLRNS